MSSFNFKIKIDKNCHSKVVFSLQEFNRYIVFFGGTHVGCSLPALLIVGVVVALGVNGGNSTS